MIPKLIIMDKIDSILREVKTEKNLRIKELLEERITVLEELLLEYEEIRNNKQRNIF